MDLTSFNPQILAQPSLAVHSGVLNPADILNKFGNLAFIVVLIIIFTECGILLGLILPGDSLLFVTGMFIAAGTIEINIWVAATLIATAAIAGNLVGYWIGEKIGPPLFRRPDSKIFKQEYVVRTHNFFEKHGARAIILARFVPIVRTLITAVAGIAKMPFRSFAINSAIGGVLWAFSMTLAGFALGGHDVIKNHIELITLGIVVLSVIPVIFELIATNKRSKSE